MMTEPPPPLLSALADIQVVELGVWASGPAAGGILADWGAEVIKVEPPSGDPARHVFRSIGSTATANPTFSFHNRGKRSAVIDFNESGQLELFDDLLRSSDVLLTNLRPTALERYDLDPADLIKRHPHLVIASINGLGSTGPGRNRPSYDIGAFWARSGLAYQLGAPDGEPLNARSGIGDRVTALALVAGVMAALFERSVSGRGQLVEVSLERAGSYVGGWDLSLQSALGHVHPPEQRTEASMPLMNAYRTSDDRWLFLTSLEAERHFPLICRAVGRADLADDQRFNTATAMRRNRRALIEVLDGVFAARSLEEWQSVLDEHGVWWEPVLTPQEVLVDQQLALNDGFVEVLVGDELVRMPNSPVNFGSRHLESCAPAPELGEHTHQVVQQ
jgi:crotonobetainyl-CoA:carnitine CoA-transferase CaiB-like acyl-CoA transferase